MFDDRAADDAEPAENLHGGVDDALRGFRRASILAMAASTVTRLTLVALPRRAIGEERGGIDLGCHRGEFRLRQLKIGQRLTKHFARGRASQRFVQCATRETERCCRDRRAKHIQRRHGNFESAPRLSQKLRARDAAILENASRASGCGAITSTRSPILNPGAVASTMNALRPRRAFGFARARKHDVEIRDAAV